MRAESLFRKNSGDLELLIHQKKVDFTLRINLLENPPVTIPPGPGPLSPR